MKACIVDSFTDRPFAGNPAGVCISESPVSEAQMLSIASEFGFSETAFLTSTDSDAELPIRYFSPGPSAHRAARRAQDLDSRQ